MITPLTADILRLQATHLPQGHALLPVGLSVFTCHQPFTTFGGKIFMKAFMLKVVSHMVLFYTNSVEQQERDPVIFSFTVVS